MSSTITPPRPALSAHGAAPPDAVAADAPDTSEAVDPARRATRLGIWMVVVGIGVAVWSAAFAWTPAEPDTRTTADEPQYLLTAISLFEDRSLDIRDELRAHRYDDFHQVALPQQTRPLEGGRRVSPHDPLLPVLLAVPVGLGGWLGAKLALAACAGLLAAATLWVAVRRFGVPVRLGAGVVLAFGIVPPLTVYATQVYPEIPAALAVVVAVGAVTGALRARGLAVFAVAVVALPWLSVKYAPVVLALVALAGWRLVRGRRWRAAVVLAGVLALNAVLFALVHRALYGGWTAYAAGDHFVGGEFTVMGRDPDYAARSVRLVGLLVDAQFGLAAWAPAFLLAVPALAALGRRRPPGWSVLLVVIAAGWANATWVALTMHGWWWPGRQVVVIVPLLVVAVAWFSARVRGALVPLALATVAALLTWVWLAVEMARGTRSLVIDFAGTTSPLGRAWFALLPDGQVADGRAWILLALWTVVLAGLAYAGWHAAGDPVVRSRLTEPSAPLPSEPLKQEHP